jgi:hypothetical protein
MDRIVFAARFSEAAERSRAFAQTLVSEPLPRDVVVRVRLNRSYPGARLRAGEVTYPGDGGWRQDFTLRRYSLHRRAECWDRADLARLHDTHPESAH